MVTMTVDDIPGDVLSELEARASRRGLTLEDYLRALLVELATSPPGDE
jgi:hypothetical protein